MIEFEKVPAADLVASVVSGTGSKSSASVVRALSYRVPVHTLALVDALSQKSGKSRNAMLNMLVDVGLEEVISRLSVDDCQEVHSREMLAIQSLMSSETETLVED